MKRTKKLLSFFLAIVMVIATIPAFSITASAATINDLKTLISRVETSGINMSQATKLKNLYTAYVSACKAYDSYYYGENTGTDITTAYNNLNNAYKACGRWTAGIDKGVKPGGFNDDNGGTGYISGTNYQNLLYNPRVENNSKVANRIFIQDASVDLEIYYGANTVVYYDGTNNKPMIPVFMLGGNTGDKARTLYTLYPCDESKKSLLDSNGKGKYDWTDKTTAPNKSNVFVMKDKWYGRNGDNYNDMNYFAAIVNNKSRVSIDNSSTFATSDNHGFDGRGGRWNKYTKYNQFCNILVYDTTPTNAIDKCSIVWFKATGGSGADDRYLKSTNDNGDEIYIYVVNYAGILNQINEKSNLFVNLSKYKEDTGSKMSKALEYCDTLTSYTYSTIDYSRNIDSLKSTLDTAYNGIKAITPTQDDPNGYPAIRSAMDSSMAIFKGKNNDGKYTATSYDAFKKAYTTAKTAMYYVATVGYDEPMTDATTIATNLKKAISNLVECADFTTLASNYTDAAAKLAETDKYTISTLNALKSVYDNAVYAKYSDTQKADTPKADNQNAIDTESANIASAIAALKERADFTYYNARIDASANNLSSYTSQSSQYLPTYSIVEPFGTFDLYTDDEKKDIDNSQQGTVYDKGLAIENARTDLINSNPVDQSGLTAFTDSLASYDKDVFDTKTVDAIKASANALYKVVNFNGTDYYSLYVTDQKDLDSKIRDYINSFNSSLDKYSVSVSSNVTVKVNGFTQSPNAETGKYEFVYGTRVEFSAPTADTAWYMNYNSESASRTQQFQKYAQTYTATIIGNMTIDARTKSDATPYRVTVERDYGVEGMTNGMAFVDYTAGGNYTLPTMPNHPYYSFDGYYVGGTKLDSNTVNITGNTTVIAKYVKNGSVLTVNVNDTSSTYAYNSKVTISEPGAYAWVEKVVGSADTWRPFYIGSGCTFRVTESIELKPVTQEQFNSMFAGKEAFAPNTRQSGAIADASTNKATINAQRVDYLPEGAQITEYGILVAKDARTDNFNLENTNENSIRAKSTKLISGNQFSIGLTNLANTNFTYRSYMIYQVPATTDETGKVTSWETKTVYSEIMTYSGATV